MKTKTLVIFLLIALAALLLSTVETYKSEWSTNHTVTSVTTNPADGQDYTISWGNMLLAPLKSALVNEKQSQAFTQALQKQLNSIGLGAQMAPREIKLTDVTPPDQVALLVSLQDYKLSRSITGWRAEGTAKVKSIRLTSNPLEKEIQMTIHLQTKGTMRGWLKRATAEKQLTERMAQAIAKGLRDDLVKKGMHLPNSPTPPSDSRSGFSWWFSFERTSNSAPESPPEVEYPLLLPQATVDYFWDTADKTVLVYRVISAGPQLEQALLTRLADLGYEHGSGHFVDAVNNRRQLISTGSIEISHWDAATSGSVGFAPWERNSSSQEEPIERYVLVVVGK